MPSRSCVLVESLESRQLLAETFSVRVNFQPGNVPVPAYCRADTGAVYGLRANGLTYGWSASNAANTRDRDSALSPDQRYDTFNHLQKNGDYKWEYALPNGNYRVSIIAGDAGYYDSNFKINVESKLVVNGTPSSSSRWVEGTAVVKVSDGRLTVSNAAGAVNNKICHIEITATTDPITEDPVVEEPSVTDLTKKTLKWTTAAAHLPRTEEMGAMVNGKLYVMGGYMYNNYLSVARMDVYDPAANKWTQLPDMPVKLSHAGTATDGRYIYLAGGYTVNAAGTKQVFGLKTVRRYDTTTGKWDTIKDLPVYRGGGSMVLLNRTLYYVGGSDEKRADHDTVYCLNLDDPNASWVQKASLPEKNNHFGMVALNGKIYVIGGQTGQDETAIFKKTSYVYDPVANTWTALAQFANPPRSHTWATTLAYKGNILLLGGEADGKDPGRPTTVQAVECYNPVKNTWSTLNKLPGARSSGVAGVWGEKIVFSTGLSFGTFKADTWIGEFM